MRWLSLILLLAISVPVISGCSEKSPEFANVATNLATESRDGTKKSTAITKETTTAKREAPSDGPKMAEGTSNMIGGAGPLKTPAKMSEAKSAATDKSAPASAAAVADPVAGTGMRSKKQNEPQLPAGILTAGSFDDNVDPRVFQSFVKKMSQQSGLQEVPAKMSGQRLVVHVKDNAGKPVGGAKVQLVAVTGQAAELVTRTDGRAVFLSSFDEVPADAKASLIVTPPGGAPITEKIDAGAARWDVTLPAVEARLPRNLDLAIILDTTGSMGDEIRYVQAEMRGISKMIHDRFPEVQQRFGLVVYRDEGDVYVAKSFDFASLDVFQKNLSAQSAAGGGDYPEAVHRGFEEANQLRWRTGGDTARVAFWIADAPPHGQHMNRTMTAVNALRKQGITIYPIACSGYDDACELVMRSCALLTGGQFLFLTDDSGVGNSHAEPKIPYYQVERLEKLMARMIVGELSGRRFDAEPADVIRTVGRKAN